MKHSRHGQAAMEFLMTYGWAILAVLVMIGALAYFGVISPNTFTPERCIVSSGLKCVDYRLSGATNLAVQGTFENGFGESIRITSATARAGSIRDTSCVTANTVVASGDRFALTGCTLTAASNGIGQKMRVDIDINYTKVQGGLYNHSASAQLYAQVQ